MRLIIAGSRHFEDDELFEASVVQWIEDHGPITEVISGMALGADSLGYSYAVRNKIPVECFPADWAAHGRAAGPIRNGQMAKRGEALLAFKAPTSKGTAGMIKLAEKNGLDITIVEID